jgi:hypothetical protein
VTWAADDKLKSRSLWETALSQSKFDFEYRLAVVSSRAAPAIFLFSEEIVDTSLIAVV